MDKIDRKIVNILQTNARASLKDLSKECFISSPAIAARISKLERSGIIKGYQADTFMLKLLFKSNLNLGKRKNFILIFRTFQTSLSVTVSPVIFLK